MGGSKGAAPPPYWGQGQTAQINLNLHKNWHHDTMHYYTMHNDTMHNVPDVTPV